MVVDCTELAGEITQDFAFNSRYVRVDLRASHWALTPLCRGTYGWLEEYLDISQELLPGVSQRATDLLDLESLVSFYKINLCAIKYGYWTASQPGSPLPSYRAHGLRRSRLILKFALAGSYRKGP